MSNSAILVNLIVETPFDYRTLYRVTSLAIKAGGTLDFCNEDIASFGFSRGGITTFMEGVCFEIQISKTVVSPMEKEVSQVNIRFNAGGSGTA